MDNVLPASEQEEAPKTWDKRTTKKTGEEHAISNRQISCTIRTPLTYSNLSYIGLTKDSKMSRAVSRQAFAEGLKSTVAAYSGIGVQLFIISQVPQQVHEPRNVYYKAFQAKENRNTLKESIRELSVPLRKHQRLQSFVVQMFTKYHEKHQLTLISFDDTYCDDARCVTGDERGSYYVNRDHLSIVGARLVVDETASWLGNHEVIRTTTAKPKP